MSPTGDFLETVGSSTMIDDFSVSAAAFSTVAVVGIVRIQGKGSNLRSRALSCSILLRSKADRHGC